MNKPTQIAFQSTFATLDEFEASKDALHAARAAIQASYACGCFLMLEQAFAKNPRIAQIEFEGDFEGWHMHKTFIKRPSGGLVWVNDLFIALDGAMEREDPESDLTLLREPSEMDIELFSEFSAEMTEDKLVALSSLEEAPIEALSQFNRMAPDFFYRAIGPRGPARLTPANAQDLARQCGLDDIASLLESARLELATAAGSPQKRTPSL